MEANVAEPFAEEHDNVEVELVPYSGVSELEGMRDDPSIDVANLDDFLVFLADEDLFLDYDESILTNESAQYDIAQYDLDYAVNSYLYRYALAVNEEEHDVGEIQSYGDLWDPQYEGTIAINTDWSIIMLLLSMGVGGNARNMDPLWENLSDLSGNVEVFYENFTDPQQYLAQGQVSISSWFDGRTKFLAEEGTPVQFHIPPEDGAVAGRGSLVVMNNTEHPELSQELVNYAIGTDAQQGYAEDLYYGPVNAETNLSTELQDAVATEQDFDELFVPEWNYIMDNIGTWRENWNENI
jgi:putative spermidine/putrescine transport system substrate-binding protein